MPKIIVPTLSILFLALSGCGAGSESDARNTVLRALKDPDSAKFGEFTVASAEKGEMACLTVNSKNSFGGYGGDKEYSLFRFNGEPWELAEVYKISHDTCVTLMRKALKDKDSE